MSARPQWRDGMYRMMVAALVALMMLAGQAWGLEKEPYTAERFAELQSEGSVVLIDVYADWCATCKMQQRALSKYRQQHPDKAFHILEVNFDEDKAVVQAFRAPRQSTLLLYRGDTQFWYSVAESRYEMIAAELNKAFTAQ